MSCILFSKGYYKHLERRSKLANHLFFECRSAGPRELQITSLNEFLFELNADAYAMRYGHREEIAAEIVAAREDMEADDIAEDYDFGKVKEWESIPQIWALLCRIRYQCEEFPDDHPAQARLRVLRWMIEKAIKMQMEKLVSAIEEDRIKKLDHCYA